MMLSNMDRIDQKILRELQLNGRLSNQELADRVGLSPSPCLRRLRLLEERGIISGYAALVDQKKVGLPINVFVSIKLERPTEAVIRRFEEGIQLLDEVMECYLMSGSHDYLLRVVTGDLQRFEQFVRGTLTTIPGIASVESSFAFGQVKQTRVLPLGV